MKKTLLTFVGYVLITQIAFAGLIVHQDYNGGDVITSSKQNTNENAVFNEFNGNIDNTNIKTGGIVGSNIAATTITSDKFATIVQNTLNLKSYRRPVLQYASADTVTIEAGLDGTSGDVSILFPDGSYRTDTNTAHTTLNLGQTANFISGTIQSGLLGGARSVNTWYAVYAVKSQANTTDIVTVAASTAPTQGNFSFLNTQFGANSWIYLGTIRNGNGLGSSNIIIDFYQAGNYTVFNNNYTGTNVSLASTGIQMATSASATTLNAAYSAGMAGTNIPSNFTVLQWTGAIATANAAQVWHLEDQTNNGRHFTLPGSASVAQMMNVTITATKGVELIYSGSAIAMDISLIGFWDGALGVGANPLL